MAAQLRALATRGLLPVFTDEFENREFAHDGMGNCHQMVDALFQDLNSAAEDVSGFLWVRGTCDFESEKNVEHSWAEWEGTAIDAASSSVVIMPAVTYRRITKARDVVEQAADALK